MKLLSLAAWEGGQSQKIPWRSVVDNWPMKEPEAILIRWCGLYFLARKAVVANAMDVLGQQQKTAQAKSPLPEPSFALCDLPVVPHPIGEILAEELR